MLTRVLETYTCNMVEFDLKLQMHYHANGHDNAVSQDTCSTWWQVVSVKFIPPLASAMNILSF